MKKKNIGAIIIKEEMPAQIGPPIYWSSPEAEDLHGSGFFGSLGKTISRGAENAVHHAAHIAGDRGARHNAGAVLSAASPFLGPEAAAGGAVLMASGKGKRAARTAKSFAKQATSKNVTRKAADIATILANQFGSAETQKAVGTAAALERALQGEGLRLAGTGDYQVRPAVMPSGAIGKSKLMRAVRNARAPRKRG